MMYTELFLKDMRSELERVAYNWSNQPLKEVKLLTVSENATFKATYEDGVSLILRVNRAFYHTLAELRSELEWVNAIVSTPNCKIKSPKVISTHEGELLVPITLMHGDEKLDLQVVAFEFCNGSEPKVGKDLIAWFEKLGQITAEMHIQSLAWKKPEGFVRKMWNFETMVSRDGYWGDWRVAPALTDEDRSVITEALDVVKQRLDNYTNDERYGLVHADLRLANLLIDGDDMIVIDYDDCGFCWYMYDFAAAISFYELDDNVPELQEAWLKGYGSIRELCQEEIDEMQTFILLRRVLLLAWVTSHAETPTAQEFSEGFAEGTRAMADKYLQFFNKAIYECAM